MSAVFQIEKRFKEWASEHGMAAQNAYVGGYWFDRLIREHTPLEPGARLRFQMVDGTDGLVAVKRCPALGPLQMKFE